MVTKKNNRTTTTPREFSRKSPSRPWECRDVIRGRWCLLCAWWREIWFLRFPPAAVVEPLPVALVYLSARGHVDNLWREIRWINPCSLCKVLQYLMRGVFLWHFMQKYFNVNSLLCNDEYSLGVVNGQVDLCPISLEGEFQITYQGFLITSAKVVEKVLCL